MANRRNKTITMRLFGKIELATLTLKVGETPCWRDTASYAVLTKVTT
jgi:hypothetical protein